MQRSSITSLNFVLWCSMELCVKADLREESFSYLTFETHICNYQIRNFHFENRIIIVYIMIKTRMLFLEYRACFVNDKFTLCLFCIHITTYVIRYLLLKILANIKAISIFPGLDLEEGRIGTLARKVLVWGGGCQTTK